MIVQELQKATETEIIDKKRIIAEGRNMVQ